MDEIKIAKERINKLEQLVNFLQSVIKSGESWTDTCEEMFNKVMEK